MTFNLIRCCISNSQWAVNSYHCIVLEAAFLKHPTQSRVGAHFRGDGEDEASFIVKMEQRIEGGLAKTVGSDLSSTGTLHFHSEVVIDERFSQMEKELEEARQERQKLTEHAKKQEEHIKKLEEKIDQFITQSSRNDSDLPPHDIY